MRCGAAISPISFAVRTFCEASGSTWLHQHPASSIQHAPAAAAAAAAAAAGRRAAP